MQSKSKTKKISKPKIKKYPAHHLGWVLVALLIVEGVLISSKPANWNAGLAVLNMSASVSETSANLTSLFAPMIDAVDGINQFYAVATNEMIPLLDMNGSMDEIAVVWESVDEFYQQASIQMSELLDISSTTSWIGSVAGVSMEK